MNYLYDVIIDLSAKYSSTTIEARIAKVWSQHQGFRHSAAITSKILRLIKNRAANVTIYAFCADDLQPFYDEFKEISRLEGFQFIDVISQAIRGYEEKGFVVKTEDHAH